MAKIRKDTILLDAQGAPIEHDTEQSNVEKLPVRVAGGTNLLEALSRTIADPASQPEKLHVLLDARKRLMEEEAEVEFEAAYLSMHDELPVINADGRIEIPSKRQGSKNQDTPYATYLNIQKITKPILKRHGFNLHTTPDVGPDGTGIVMRGKLNRVCETQYGKLVWAKTCAVPTVIEASGSKNQAQGITSGISYAKRQCAVTLLDLVSAAKEDRDDDGKSARSKKEREAEASITKGQLQTLEKRVRECGVSREKVLAKYQVDDLAQLPASHYADALAACNAYETERRNRESHG